MNTLFLCLFLLSHRGQVTLVSWTINCQNAININNIKKKQLINTDLHGFNHLPSLLLYLWFLSIISRYIRLTDLNNCTFCLSSKKEVLENVYVHQHYQKKVINCAWKGTIACHCGGTLSVHKIVSIISGTEFICTFLACKRYLPNYTTLLQPAFRVNLGKRFLKRQKCPPLYLHFWEFRRKPGSYCKFSWCEITLGKVVFCFLWKNWVNY